MSQHSLSLSHTERPRIPTPHSEFGGQSSSGFLASADSRTTWFAGDHISDDILRKNRASYSHDSMAATHFQQQHHMQQGSHRKRAESIDTYTYARVKY